MNIIQINEPLEDLHQILDDQNHALGKAFAALSNIREWAHHEYLGGCKIAGTTLANLLDETIESLCP